MPGDREPMSLEALGGFLPAFTAIAGGYGFLDAADALDRLSRANTLLEAPIPVIAVALALPPHDPEADELVRAYTDADPDATLPDELRGPRLNVVENTHSWVQLSMQWPVDAAEAIARGVVPRPALWWQVTGTNNWIRHCSARPLEPLARWFWNPEWVSGMQVEFGLAPWDTRPSALIVPLLEVERP